MNLEGSFISEFAMSAHRVATLLLFAATTLGAQESKLWYTPGTVRYRISTSSTTAQEMQGQKQEFSASSEQRVSVTIGKAKGDSLPLSIVLDSITQTTNAPMAPDVSKLIGMHLEGVMSPQGRVYTASVKAADGTEAIAQQTEALKRFLPRLPATIRTGVTWTDTVEAKMPMSNGVELSRSAIVNYAVLGDTTIAGQKVWKISMESKAKVAGKGSQGGADFTIDGGATGHGMTYVAPDGWFVGMDASEQQELAVTVAAVGMIIPVTTSSTTKVERIR